MGKKHQSKKNYTYELPVDVREDTQKMLAEGHTVFRAFQEHTFSKLIYSLLGIIIFIMIVFPKRFAIGEGVYDDEFIKNRFRPRREAMEGNYYHVGGRDY